MKKIIHHIRGKSEETRKHILHVFTVVLALILVLLWIYSLGNSFNNKESQVKLENDLKPLSVLKDNLVGGYQSISQGQ